MNKIGEALTPPGMQPAPLERLTVQYNMQLQALTVTKSKYWHYLSLLASLFV